MKPTADVYTIALPWYDREEFAELWALAHDRTDMPADYDVWHRSATAVVNAWLARGRALQIVTVRPPELVLWLESRGLPNIAENRRKYVEELATRGHDAA